MIEFSLPGVFRYTLMSRSVSIWVRSLDRNPGLRLTMLALLFQIGEDRVAVDARQIHEVIPRVKLSPLTDSPASIAGVFVYRGQVVPVIDLHHMNQAGPCPQHLSSRIILCKTQIGPTECVIGLLATQVAEIRDLKTDQLSLQGLSPSQSGLGPAFPDGQDVIRMLDPTALLERIWTNPQADSHPEPHSDTPYP